MSPDIGEARETVCHAVARAKRQFPGQTCTGSPTERRNVSGDELKRKSSKRSEAYQPESYRISNLVNRTAISLPTDSGQISSPAPSALSTRKNYL